MKLLKTFVQYGDNGHKSIADLYETKTGYQVQINFEIEEIHVARIVVADDNLKLWNECVT